ncbi:putative phosphatidate phosphatase isoform X2 [Dermacentor variabilis]|uniref:putative phosphatidate phosphatase isoform X2 n=1 Tax=Dermacentor variabilis TaxID=34621 RepID=UPI003F5BA1FB
MGIEISASPKVGVPILVLFVAGKPFKRGFFCDDESLMYPFRDSTVTSPMLYSYGILIPIIVMTVLEGMRARLHVQETIATSKKLLYKWKVPSSLQVLYMLVGVFLMGAAISQLLTDIAKYTIGRLRPHFFDLCQPVNLKVLCAQPYTYVENFTCGSNATEHQLKEMRLSFMSGHSSFSAYTMMYTALYIHARMPWRNSVAMAARTVIQVALLSLAWYTALSRVSNYKHHWSDVLAGSAEGYLVAIVVVWGIAPLFNPHGGYLITGGSETPIRTTYQTDLPLNLKSRSFHDEPFLLKKSSCESMNRQVMQHQCREAVVSPCYDLGY